MLAWLIRWSLAHRSLVCGGAGLVVLMGVASLRGLSFDAFPDTTPIQVQVNTTATAFVAEEVERQITVPIELAIFGMAGLEQVRSVSQFGLSQVVVTFRDGTNIYLARQLVNERLAQVQIPDGIEKPQLGPVSTGLGEVFHYILSSASRNLTDVRTLHDWEVKPLLRRVAGTAEINSWGGFEKQYQVRVDPVKLITYDLGFQQVIDAVLANNLNVGGGSINRSQSGEMLLVHGVGRTTTVPEIEEMVITARDGVPVLVRDVAEVVVGHEIRRGMVTSQGQGEAVLGLGFMLMGENSYAVTSRLKAALEDVRRELNAEIDLKLAYDRTELVDQVIDTVKNNLCEAALLVVVVLYVMMGQLRPGLVVAVAIPMSLCIAFGGMRWAGIAGTLLSLGAIDFGVVVESNVVVIENVVRRLAHASGSMLSKREVVRQATTEVRQPAVFGQLIIMIVYIPLLTLEGVEGKMFRPMAWTLMFLLTGSLLCSLTLIPVLASLIMPSNLKETDPWIVRLAQWCYRPILAASLRWPDLAIGLGLAGLMFAAVVAVNLGTEFVPRLSEGAVVIGFMRAPGTDLEESIRINTRMEQALLREFPDEIENIWTRTGAPHVATDPGGVETGDMFITLRPRSAWKRAVTQTELVSQMEPVVGGIPGQDIWFTQPIEQRINEMVSGVRSDIALKLFGDDVLQLVTVSKKLEDVLKTIPGSSDVVSEQINGQPILQVHIHQDQIARYGISTRAVLDVVESIGSKPVGMVVEGKLRFPLAIRLPERYRTDPDAIGGIMVTSPLGTQIPLSRLAEIRVINGPRMIPHEWGERRISVMCNVRGRDIGTFVNEAQRKILEQVSLPDGYTIDWGGQFENMIQAQRRLAIVVPLALLLIMVLLYTTYRNLIDTAFVFTSVPFACVGGILALWFRDLPISISAAVGFITLSGVSVLNNMVVVSAIRDLQAHGLPQRQAIHDAALERLRTRLMTACVAIFGFLPMALSTGVGAEVQRPLATVVVGGVISSTVMTLFVLPALYMVAPPRRVPLPPPSHG